MDTALQTTRPYIKFAKGLVKDNKATTIDGRTVTILAEPGAKLDRDGDGLILIVQSSNDASETDVRIFDLEITGSTGGALQLQPISGAPSLSLTHVTIDNNQGAGVLNSGGTLVILESTFSNNQGTGVTSTGGTLTISRSIFDRNRSGGIYTTSLSQIVGNSFSGNGNPESIVGGIYISSGQSKANRLDFNSFYGNSAQTGFGQAVDCHAGVFVARNNIMSYNGTLDDVNQQSGSCAHEYSIARPGTPLSGTTNSTIDPLFVDPSNGDLRLQPTSPARGAADPNSDLTGVASQDIDGASRTAPATIGAYQLKPQGTP